MLFVRFILRRFESLGLHRSAFLYWILLVIVSSVSIVCGYLGWMNWQLDPSSGGFVPRSHEDRSWQTIIEAVQLSVKSIFASDIYISTSLQDMPPKLQIARLFGSFAFVLMFGRIFIFALGGKASRLFMWARKNHDVVLGDHELAEKYATLAEVKVTHITNSNVGHNTLKPDGRLEVDLVKAGVSRARRVIVAMSSDVETWSEAQKIAHIYPNTEILAHITDPWLLERIGKADPATHLKPFSFVSGAAREVMLAHPPYLLARRKQSDVQHIIIVGFGYLGQALVREFLITSISNAPARMAVTIIDPDAKKQSAAFKARHPGLSDYVDFAFMAGELTLKSPTIEAHLNQRCKDMPACAVYIALEEEEHPLVSAVAIKDRAEREGWFDAPIFVNSAEGSGLKKVRQGAGQFGQEANVSDTGNSHNILSELSLIPFGSWENGMDGTELLTPDYDEIPRKFHETYIETLNKTNKAKVLSNDWDLLEEEFRVANRRVAGHIRATLDAAGFDLNAWLEKGSEGGHSYKCTDLPEAAANFLDLDNVYEIEKLAQLQHKRWMFDRLLNGWKYDPVRNNQARLHNCLVEYDQLDESTKEQDRAMVRQIASIIRSV